MKLYKLRPEMKTDLSGEVKGSIHVWKISEEAEECS
jgi:hypothetical protein